MYSSKSIFIA